MSYIGNSPGVASSRVTTTLTATAAQTQFTTQSGYVLGYVDVYLNGAKLVNGADFEAITGTYITLFTGAVAGDVVELISYVPRGLSDGYTKAEADAKFLDVGGDTATGTMNLAVNSLVVGTNQLVTSVGNVGIGTAVPTSNAIVRFLNINDATSAGVVLSAARNYSIYSSSSSSLAFRDETASVNRMTIDSAGNTGIGTTGSITSRLDVVSSSGSYNGGIRVNGITTGGNSTSGMYIVGSQASTHYNWLVGSQFNISNAFEITPSTAVNGTTFTSPALVVLQNGNVGINTNNPTCLLYVASTANPTTIPALGAASTHFAVGNSTAYGTMFGSLNTGNGYIQQQRFDGTATAYNLFLQPNGGNVGIGQTSPVYKLHVTSAGGTTEIAASNTAGAERIHLISRSTAGVSYLRGENSVLLIGTFDNYYTAFVANNAERARISTDGTFRVKGAGAVGSTDAVQFSGSAPASAMALDASGNFFVGTTTNTNSSKLVVNGSISQTVGGTQYLVVDQSDVGTAPNQIPLNQHLGSMAFQDRENVNFTGGTGALSSLDIAAINAQLNVSATDVFVYDTSKDSDGGAWRKRCQHTSWYNETLNTATRGARREFPVVAVFVLETNKLTILDADDPTMPMWMVFNASSSGLDYALGRTLSSKRSVYALNATFAIGGSYSSAHTEAYLQSNFVSEVSIYIETNRTVTRQANIAQRNSVASVTYGTQVAGSGLINIDSCNDIAMTVLPNAPVDSATGLPIPTIAVATAGGANVIHNNGTIISISTTDANWANFRKVSFLGSRMVINPSFTGSVNNTMFYTLDIPYTSVTFTSINADIPNVNALYYHSDSSIPNLLLTTPLWNSDIVGGEILGKGGNTGLNFIREDLASKSGITSKGMVAYANTKYNTGWMPGNIKGAWLSDTTQETVVGTELVTNGTFTTDTSGWSVIGGTISVVSGALRLTDTSGSFAYATTSFPTVVGSRYVISVNHLGSPGSSYIRVGPTDNSTQYLGSNPIYGAAARYIYTIVAATTTTYVTLISGQSTYGDWDDVSVRLADADRSVNNKGLQVFGSITKTPVAANADLVAYSGFSSTNYLSQPYNSGFDFGTGDFCVSGWAKNNNNTASTQAIISRGGGGERGFQILRTTSSGATYTNSLYVRITTSTADSIYANGIDKTIFLNGVWNHIVLLRRSGIIFVYFNNSLVLSFENAGTISPNTNGTPTLIFGTPNTTVNEMSLALWKVSASAPSDAQITKMYNDEKYLFQENSKATLYGTSDAVTTVAYDHDTQLLHAGTSSGRSVFDGLRRVDNTTTAVTTAISAADGLVVES